MCQHYLLCQILDKKWFHWSGIWKTSPSLNSISRSITCSWPNYQNLIEFPPVKGDYFLLSLASSNLKSHKATQFLPPTASHLLCRVCLRVSESSFVRGVKQDSPSTNHYPNSHCTEPLSFDWSMRWREAACPAVRATQVQLAKVLRLFWTQEV